VPPCDAVVGRRDEDNGVGRQGGYLRQAQQDTGSRTFVAWLVDQTVLPRVGQGTHERGVRAIHDDHRTACRYQAGRSVERLIKKRGGTVCAPELLGNPTGDACESAARACGEHDAPALTSERPTRCFSDLPTPASDVRHVSSPWATSAVRRAH